MTLNARRYERTCDRCGTDFTAAKPSARYCSENCRKRTHDAAHRAACVDCGEPMGIRSGYPNAADTSPRLRCAACSQANRRAGRDVRAEQIVGWWQEGLTMNDICAKLSWSRGSLASEMNWMREQGFELAPRRSDVGIPNPRRGRRAVAA